MTRPIRELAAGTSVWTGDVWVGDSTPVECGRSRETARRSYLAGWAGYGYCASHSRHRHGGHTPAGVLIRVLQRILALTAAIWHRR